MTITTMATLIQWDYGSPLFTFPTSCDCEHAAWYYKLRNGKDHDTYPFWNTLRDMMLHGY